MKKGRERSEEKNILWSLGDKEKKNYEEQAGEKVNTTESGKEKTGPA